jgi:hypothetical protein
LDTIIKSVVIKINESILICKYVSCLMNFIFSLEEQNSKENQEGSNIEAEWEDIPF